MADPVVSRIPEHFPPAVQRILLWCALGCSLQRVDGRWRLERPAAMTGSRGPAPTAIQERAAQAAIQAGAPVTTGPDLFGAYTMQVAA